MKKSLLERLEAFAAAVIFFFILFPANLFAAESERPLSFIADTKGLSGFWLWYANLYNTNKLYCALVTIIIVPVTGLAIGILADLIMNNIGIDLRTKKH